MVRYSYDIKEILGKNKSLESIQSSRVAAFDFTKPNSEIYNNILIAGENGAGKTTFLEIFTQFRIIFTGGWYEDIKSHMPDFLGNSCIGIEFEHKGEIFLISSGSKDEHQRELQGNLRLIQQFKVIYSSVDINYSSRTIPDKSLDMDFPNESVVAIPINLLYPIVELLILINSQDNNDISSWVCNHPREVSPVIRRIILKRHLKNKRI